MTNEEIGKSLRELERIHLQFRLALEALAKAYPNGLNPLVKDENDIYDYIDEHEPVEVTDTTGGQYYILGLKPYDGELTFLAFDDSKNQICWLPWYKTEPSEFGYILQSIKQQNNV